MSRTFRTTSPACDATCSARAASAGASGSFGGLCTAIAPRRSSPCRTGNTAVAPSKALASSPPPASGGGIVASPGHAATARSSGPTRIHTSARVAPVPLASSATIRSSCSSSGSVFAIESANSDSTWYGDARSPYTIRFATACARCRSGWNSSAIATAATIVSTGPPCDPRRAPTPTTIAT